MRCPRILAAVATVGLILTLGACAQATEGIPGSSPTLKDQFYAWLKAQQLPNGLVPSVEGGSQISLYDNALAALAYTAAGDTAMAGRIFQFFENRRAGELTPGSHGGFYQFRDSSGTPLPSARWMGDNAWLLLSLNFFRSVVGPSAFQDLHDALQGEIVALQASDGGITAGDNADGTPNLTKVTEGNVDAWGAVEPTVDGTTSFHAKLEAFLKNQRWDTTRNCLVSWVNPPDVLLTYAVDNFSWAWLCFPDYPDSQLSLAETLFVTTKSFPPTGASVTGFCQDQTLGWVWLEATGQMADAFALAGNQTKSQVYLDNLSLAVLRSPGRAGTSGLSYTTTKNASLYGGGTFWPGADSNICVSSTAWAWFAMSGFNPFGLAKARTGTGKFWQ